VAELVEQYHLKQEHLAVLQLLQLQLIHYLEQEAVVVLLMELVPQEVREVQLYPQVHLTLEQEMLEDILLQKVMILDKVVQHLAAAEAAAGELLELMVLEVLAEMEQLQM
jgi:hypothetical protein